MSYESLKSDLRGVAFTVPTPFTEDGDDVRHDDLAAHVSWLRDRGVRVVIPCGNTGEYYSLTNDERVAVVETAADAMGGEGTVVGGAGGSTKNAIGLAEQYEAVGADAVMVMYPGHTYAHDRGMRRYYERIADATDLGVLLYRRGPRVSVETIAALSERENVVAVKFADDDIAAFAEAVDAAPGDVVWSNGIAERYAPAFAAEGAEGFTTGTGNFVPRLSLALMEAIRDEDYERIRRLRDLLRPFENLRAEAGADSHMANANNVPAVKYGLELAGHYGGPVREPLVELSEADRERAEEYYERMRGADVSPRQE